MKLPELQTALPDFEAANQLADGINDQNVRSARIFSDLEDPDFQYIAQEALQLEQAQTLAQLSEYAQELPYAELSKRYLSVLEQLGRATQKLAAVQHETSEAAIHYDALADRTIELAPLSEERARGLADEKKQQLIGSSVLAIEQKISDLHAEKQGLEDLYEVAGNAWPIPQGPELDDEPGEETTVVLDEIPVEPVLQDGNVGVEGLLERHVDAPEASQWTVIYLIDQAERVVTVQDLYEFLYSPEVVEQVDEYHLRSRITTMLGPKVGSLDIQEMLADEGFVLQFGWRITKTYGEDDKVTNFARHRIYRAVPEDKFSVQHLERTIIGNDIYMWETTKEQRDSLLRKSLPDTNGSDNGGHESNGQNPRLSWENDFIDRVDTAIETLSERGLIQPGTMSTKLISKLAQSRALGTRTAVSRLTKAGILPGTKGRLASELTASQLVAMSLFNPCRSILSKGNRQDKAMEIIQQRVQAHLVRLETRERERRR